MDHNPHAPLPGSGAAALMSEAKACLGRSDGAKAIQLLQRARGLEPNNDRVLVLLGRAFTETYDFAAAQKCFEAAVAIASIKVDPLIAVGHYWMDVRHFEAAKDYFARALEQPHVRIVAYIRLAEMLIRLKRLDEAADVAERALKIDASHEGALLIRAKVHRQQKQLAEAEKLLRIVVGKSDYPSEARAAAGYELGAVLDLQERYEEAMSAFLDAKALLRLTAAPASSILRQKQARMKEAQSAVTPALVQKWRQFGDAQLQPRRNLALLCGHARSGTTLLEYVLDAHPEIVSADETAVFQAKTYATTSAQLGPKTPLLSALDSLPARTLRQLRADYLCGMESFLGQTIGERLLIDKNPALTSDIAGVLRVFPETKFIVALRDPRDVCLSCFMQAWPVLPDTVPWLSLEATVQQYAITMGFWNAWKPCLGGSAIEVRYEDVVNDLEGSARRALQFLNVPWNERVLNFHEETRTKIVRSPTFVEVGKPLYKTAVARWKHYEKFLAPHMEPLKPFLTAFGYE